MKKFKFCYHLIVICLMLTWLVLNVLQLKGIITVPSIFRALCIFAITTDILFTIAVYKSDKF